MSSTTNKSENISISSPIARTSLQWRALGYRFLRNWYWFVLSLLSVAFLTWLFLRSASPTFLVRGTFLLREEQYNSSFSQDVGIVIETHGARLQQMFLDQTQMMKSLSVMRQVVDTLGIDVQYYVSGRLKDAELYKDEVPIRVSSFTPARLLYGKQINVVPIDGNRFGILQAEGDTVRHRYDIPFDYKQVKLLVEKTGDPQLFNQYKVYFRDPIKVARSYSRKINFTPVANSFVIAATLVDEKHEKAIDIIETLLSVYNTTVVEDKNKVGQNTLGFIEERLQEMEDELFTVEKEVEQYKQREDIPLELATRTQLLLSDVSEIEKLALELRLEIELLDNFQESFQENIEEFDYLPVSSEVSNSAVSDLFATYNELILERERLLQNAKRSNPLVQNIEEEIANMRANIDNGLAILVSEKQKQLQQQEARLRPFQQRIVEVPRNERELFDIERQKLVKDELYRFLLQTREETRLSIATQVPDTKMVDEPMLQNLVFPKIPQVALFAFILAMFFPAGILFVRESTDNNLYNEGDISRMTETPFLGVIGQSRSKKPVVLRRSSRSAVAEMFRLVRTNLQFLLGPDTDKGKVILITSAKSGEGKTFIGLNLGLSLAFSGKKTVIVGADLRKPKLATYLTGDKAGDGLSNYLVGQKELDDLVQPSGLDDNFFYIGSGPLPPNPAELLMQDRMKELLVYLRTHYDTIIIDISPVGLVTDALLLQEEVDASIFVTRFKVTKKGALYIIDDIYRNNKLPNTSIILNGVKRSKAYGYGDGRYGYGYGYGYGYYEEEKADKWWNKLIRRGK
ncbi:MAG: polysaccharide biosynthesis tyrosine autokinase [Bacteroidota bacterium]